jgi:Uncharacterized conserved protein
MKKHLISLAAVSVMLLVTTLSCMDEGPATEPTDIKFTYGAYFLNGGNAGRNDAELTQLNTLYSIVNQNVFKAVNGKALGDDGKDLLAYGDRMYVALAGSRRISVIDPSSCKESATIKVEAEGDNLTPVSLAAFEGSILVGLKEGCVAAIDTATLKVTSLQTIEGEPVDMAVANQKLYVTNYRVDGQPGAAIQMLNPVDLHVMKTIDVRPGPRYLTADPTNNTLFLISEGDGNGESAFQYIDTDLEEVSVIGDVVKPALMAAGPDQSLVVYVKDTDDELGGRFIVFTTSPGAQKVEGGFIRDGSYVRNPCGIFIDQATGNVYIAEKTGADYGNVFIYTSYGQYITSFNTGAGNPCAGVFLSGETTVK